jgi:beta-ribofuranosylaminobenzene 5'-phosphate synthase
LQSLVGRGGASGIGIHAFFSGGLIWDGGHAFNPDRTMLPSSLRRNETIPPLISRWDFPESWRVWLLLPDESQRIKVNEVELFRQNAPIPKSEAYETLAALYHGVVPAFRLLDIDLLAHSLRDLHKAGFKRRELDAHPEKTRNVLNALHDRGIAAGMSSLGPLIYAIVEQSDQESIRFIQILAQHNGLSCAGPVMGRNRGAIVQCAK